VVTCLTVWGVAIAAVASSQHKVLGQAVETAMRARAEVFASVLMQEANLATSSYSLHRLVKVLAGGREVVDVAVLGGEPERVLAATRHAWLEQPLAVTGCSTWQEVHGAGSSEAVFQSTADHVACDYVMPFRFSNLNIPELRNGLGWVMVRLDGRDAAAAARTTRNAQLIFLMLVPLLVVLAVMGVLFLHVLRPIRRLRGALARRAAGDLAARPGTMPNRDLQALGDGLHALLDGVDKAQAHLRAIVGTASDAIVTIDERGLVTQWNPGAEKMFGKSFAEVAGTNIARFVPEPERSHHDGYVQRHLGAGVARVLGFTREVVAERADGSTFPCGLSVNAATVGGERFFVGILRDMTGEVRARRELEVARQAAESAAQAKSAFLANMSHEIRTPLTAILGYAEELETGDLALDERMAAVRIIHNNGQHLMTVINDILDMSKIEAGQLRVEQVECQPDAIAMEVVGMMQGRARGKGLTLELSVASVMPRSICSDSTRLRQILINLVGNAIKFTEHGGVAVELRMGFGSQSMSFAVIDTGIGITPEQQAKLFRSFVQADDSTSRRYGGTGLGLDISKRLAGMLGGDIVVTSVPGRGSRFECTIATGPAVPASNGSVAVQLQRRGFEVPQLQGRVLIADDGKDNQRLIKRVLAAAGLDVTIAENGLQARDAVLAGEASQPFDLVLMDMQMPVMDGLQATRELRAAGFARPIVALTANVMAEDQARCREAGCSHFAAKPLDRAALYATLRAALVGGVTPVPQGRTPHSQTYGSNSSPRSSSSLIPSPNELPR
jgi:PAS domain S-box-containing protein